MKLFHLRQDRTIETISLPASGGVALDGIARLVIADGEASVLLATGDVAVNGLPALPAVVLRERDEIHAGGVKYFLAAEEPAPVEFAPRESKTCCARCKSVLAAGEPVMFCPSCRSVHHSECWKYSPRCAGCEREPAGEWRPE